MFKLNCWKNGWSTDAIGKNDNDNGNGNLMIDKIEILEMKLKLKSSLNWWIKCQYNRMFG